MKKLMLGLAFAVTAEAGWTKGGTGTETDPWDIGTLTYSYENVKAWTNGTGRLTITGTGDTIEVLKPHPWPNTIKEVVVGDGVTSIGSSAFQDCGSLTTVEMPSVTSIGISAFQSCGSLTTVEMPSVITIGSSAFYDCGSLTTVEMPSVITIGSSAFYDCGSLTTVEMSAVTSIGDSAFFECGSLTAVVMPAVTTIGASAFFRCTKLTSITILTKNPPTCGDSVFFQVPTICMMFIPPTADVDVWQSILSSAGYNGGFQKVPVFADNKGCSTSAEVNAAIADGCKKVAFYGDCDWGLEVPEGKETTFDLCGKTLTGTLTVNGDLTVNDTSDQRTGKVTGEVQVGTNGSFTWKGSQNWTVATVGEIEQVMSFNRRFDTGIAVTMSGDIADAVELPAGVPLTIDLNGKTFGGALTVNGDLTVKDSVGGGSVVQSEYPVVATTGSLKFENAAITIKGIFSMPSAEQKPEPSGAVSGAEFESVQIVDGKAYLDVSVWTSDTITNQNWSVATNGVIEVPAEGKTGFFILQSKAAVPSDNNPANIIIEDR